MTIRDIERLLDPFPYWDIRTSRGHAGGREYVVGVQPHRRGRVIRITGRTLEEAVLEAVGQAATTPAPARVHITRAPAQRASRED
jgi:hypothetical protein